MDFTHTLLAGIAATTVMTLFSKWAGYLFAKEFSEPKLLDAVVRPSPEVNKSNHLPGWTLHYAIGIIFAVFIQIYAIFSESEYTYLEGFLLGTLLGCLGVIGWLLLLALLKKPPQLDTPAFFVQLVFAHIIFGLVAIWVFRIV